MCAAQLNINTRWRDGVWALTVLLGAWLLFQIQPMVGKRVLPWFGGGVSVWTTAMLFFQAALLAGYLYAHLSARLLRPRVQAMVHVGLLAAALVVLTCEGVLAGEAWKPAALEFPRLQVLGVLAGTIGLAYLMLAATGPLVQFWWGHGSARPPYRLYALSNLGSLLGLVSYPLVVEPYVGLSAQGQIWFGMFGVFTVLCAASAWIAYLSTKERTGEISDIAKSSNSAISEYASSEARQDEVANLDRFLWLSLPACASALLLAVTNFLCQDVASLPLLWIAPLAIYLATFIVAFDADRWYVRPLWLTGLCMASFVACLCWRRGSDAPLGWQVGSHLALLLCVGMVCHGEVARLRPSRQWLTSYYLQIALGGALGGLFVAVIAPLVFAGYYELPLTVLAAWILAMIVLGTGKRSTLSNGGGAWIVIVVVWVILAAMYLTAPANTRLPVVASARNFFGVLRVHEKSIDGESIFRLLFNGQILHGSQFLAEERRRDATTYYSSSSGIGQLFALLPAAARKRVGIVGLGVGTLATYAENGDKYRFYEINPQVISLADNYFTFLGDARKRGAEINFVEGDARLALEREPSQQFDVLVLDAFSGDAIPVHLLTREAFAVFQHHLRPNGILAIHITNRHLDLAPIVLSSAKEHGFGVRIVTNVDDLQRRVQAATWAFLYPNSGSQSLQSLGEILEAAPTGRPVVWTDDYSSLFDVLKND